ncbi:hypothetical protein [Enterococcus diestrammenae]|uniref:Uncharacterized protein n=1 Tax=Enterococcus diestrammenae TaxID=1155073 RepID=A0ABV0F0G1_9ENTE|nr:hypothetical protein [Enterococcus diestrammenae]KAF1296342.1 hypothetical protein BAU18_06090 [Enterococcus diestrammenae]
MAIKAEDILVLSSIQDKRVQVANPYRLITGSFFMVNDVSEHFDIDKSIDRLYSEGLIRKNFPKEYIPYFNVAELKNLLTEIGCKKIKTKTKYSLVELAKVHLSDENIINSPLYKPFYIITDSGFEALEKYHNVVWFSLYKYDIYGHSDHNNRFNIQYFFSHPEIDPYEEMVEYFQDKNDEVVGRLYYLKNDFRNSVLYGIKTITSIFTESIDNAAGSKYRIESYNLQRIFWSVEWVKKSYSHFAEDSNQFIDEIQNCYDTFKYKNEIAFDLFSEIVFKVLLNEVEDFSSLQLSLINILEENFPDEDDYGDFNERYVAAQADQAALLGLLISHLDLEMLTLMKEQINIRIKEFEELN